MRGQTSIQNLCLRFSTHGFGPLLHTRVVVSTARAQQRVEERIEKVTLVAEFFASPSQHDVHVEIDNLIVEPFSVL